ncbi:MAG: hypothetical protein FWH57_00815 [Oscillospiraceae bacterium]|nr:hypothetical protein [Oscillospiraceae bacterium]
MSHEEIEAICLAEDEALQKILLATKKADEVIEAAQNEGKETIASTLLRAETEIAYFTHTIDQKAMGEAMELASTTANRQATLRARAERRIEAAASLIVERIVNL